MVSFPRTLFNLLLVSVVVTFVWIRPLTSPWHPFIAGDGLGYYAYLPATFIYHDQHFGWFREVHDRHYPYSAFEDPLDNFMVDYNGTRVNKYYPGLAFIWMPFFLAAHVVAVLTGFDADGFSPPYQWAVGLASLLFLLGGLYYLRRLVLTVFRNEWAALLACASVFFGTQLFSAAVFLNSLTHVYSFALVTFLFYQLVQAERNPLAGLSHLTAALLAIVLIVCIRPVNVILVVVIPAWLSWRSFTKTKLIFKWRTVLAGVVMLIALMWQVALVLKQTGEIFPDTYPGETFAFSRPRLLEAMLGYRIGLFTYAPVLLLGVGAWFYKPPRRLLVLPLFFLFVLYLYSCWWYWPIVKRALIDFYVIPALGVAWIFTRLNRRGKWVLLIMCVIFCGWFQLKALQVRRGVLDENATHADLFWSSFFTTKKTSTFSVPPKSILFLREFSEPFEDPSLAGRSSREAHGGTTSLLLDSTRYINRVMEVPMPAYAGEGILKIRFSFWCFPAASVSSVHAFIQLYSRDGIPLAEQPFYMNREDLYAMEWDRKEFGVSLPQLRPSQLEGATVACTIWNVKGRDDLFVDDARVEIMFTDRAFETLREQGMP